MLRNARRQDGYTLVELIVASAVGVIVMTGLTSIILTSVQAGVTATSRVEASSQVRNFGLEAYDDFALSGLPHGGCASPCLSPIFLQGLRADNSAVPAIGPYQVSYSWTGPLTGFINRTVGNNPPVHAASGVTSFSWYVDASDQTVVVSLTVTVDTYAESQTFRFHPRLVP